MGKELITSRNFLCTPDSCAVQDAFRWRDERGPTLNKNYRFNMDIPPGCNLSGSNQCTARQTGHVVTATITLEV